MYNYVTLDQIKNYIGGGIESLTVDDVTLAEFADWAARLIEDYKGRRYDVRRELRVYDTPRAAGSSFGSYGGAYPLTQDPPLRLDEDLLEVIELVNGDGEEILSTQYLLEPGNLHPKNRIRLRRGYSWTEAAAGPEQAIQLTGWWGYHDRYTEAWRFRSNTAGAVDEDDLVIPVADETIYQAGQLIRIEDELMLVEDLVEATHGLQVERGANGSLAESHLSAAAVETYRPMGLIAQIAMRLVKWRYEQRHTDNFDRSYAAGSGIVSIPTALPADVVRLLGARKAR